MTQLNFDQARQKKSFQFEHDSFIGLNGGH